MNLKNRSPEAWSKAGANLTSNTANIKALPTICNDPCTLVSNLDFHAGVEYMLPVLIQGEKTESCFFVMCSAHSGLPDFNENVLRTSDEHKIGRICQLYIIGRLRATKAATA